MAQSTRGSREVVLYPNRRAVGGRVRRAAAYPIPRPPEVVLSSNHPHRGDEPEGRLHDILHWCSEGRVDEWTCKKTAAKGDVYLFWFHNPIGELLAVGVSDGNVIERENDGWDWTDSPKGWFCAFDPLVALKNPVTLNDIATDPGLAAWWKKLPFRGRPKKIVDPDRRGVLELIRDRNWNQDKLLLIIGEFIARDEETLIPPTPDVNLVDDDGEPPPSVTYTARRVVRSTAKGEELKRLYEWRCQVCGYSMRIPSQNRSERFVEVHHLRPLGGGHHGRDHPGNMLVLCPNCHAAFDYLAMALHPRRLRVQCFDKKHPHHNKKVSLGPEHRLDESNLIYHRERCFSAWSEQS